MDNISKEKRVRFYPSDTDETFDGTVIDEKPNFYVVIPDQNLALTQNWSKKRCDIIGSAIRPPLGLIPKRFHDERVKVERFNEVCGAISRYYDAGLKINIEWIEEYNELVECVGKHYR